MLEHLNVVEDKESSLHFKQVLQLAEQISDTQSFIEELTDELSTESANQSSADLHAESTDRLSLDEIFANLKDKMLLFSNHLDRKINIPMIELIRIVQVDPQQKSLYAANRIYQVAGELQEQLDPLVKLALSRPADFVESLKKVFKVLNEINSLTKDPLDDNLKFIMALYHGLPDKPELASKKPAQLQQLQAIEDLIDCLLDSTNPVESEEHNDYHGRTWRTNIKIDASLIRLTSNTKALYPASIQLQKPREANLSWRYRVTYGVGDRDLSKEVVIIEDQDVGLIAKIKQCFAKQWQQLTYEEACKITADLEDLLNLVKEDSLYFLIDYSIDNF